MFGSITEDKASPAKKCFLSFFFSFFLSFFLSFFSFFLSFFFLSFFSCKPLVYDAFGKRSPGSNRPVNVIFINKNKANVLILNIK